MQGAASSSGWTDPPHCRFELAPPRNFLYPAVLLLLSEKPRHGYRLVEPLGALGFGPADRPTVYRALADLERDGLLESWDAEPAAGATRHVYALTAVGRRALDHWMGVLAVERDRLSAVVERYALLDHTPAPPAARAQPHLLAAPVHGPEHARPHTTDAEVHDERPAAEARTFSVVEDQSAIMIRARSSVGTIEFGTTGLRGDIVAELRDGAVASARGRVEVDVAGLTSGNSLYDAELRRRVDARAFPHAAVELDEAHPLGTDGHVDVAGQLTFHGVSVKLDGSVGVSVVNDDRLVVTGERVIDIREFHLEAPTLLMLRIYPDVQVFLHLEASAS
jgi:DNA-binding PadR family transcriptional regulator/polyisoprenoid-binding protein YceI